MAIGERIRFIRNLKGMTQKYLGISIGFSEKTADIRMAQYENGTRTPKQDLINAIASQLDVSPSALNVPDIDSEIGLIHTLFALEDMYGATVKNIDGEIHICFNSNNTPTELYRGLSEWAKAMELYSKNSVVKENYDNWRYNYPEYNIEDFDINSEIKSPEEEIAEFEKIQYRFYSEHPEAASKEYLEAHPEILKNKQDR
jgi:transcriptional regulator with XRE-family HTH domain